MNRTIYILLLCIVLALTSCSQSGKRYRIGVSQCSQDIWREKQNAELRLGAYFHENVDLMFATAYDSDQRQVQQIDSLVQAGIDLLIVAPNQMQTISPAIDRAYDKGIPVIVFERKTSSQKYTAFISADNYEMGHVIGEHVVSRLNEHGTVLEIKGLAQSSPAIERHNGFTDALGHAPGITLAASLDGDWTESTAFESVLQWLMEHSDAHIDLVFGANDRTAMGARRAFRYLSITPMPLFCGIDGLPGKDGGIQLVRDSLLDVSYIYPTHGDQIIDLAVQILDGRPFDKETMLMSALVTRDNAKVLLMESEEIMRQATYLGHLHEKADGYMRELGTQRIVSWLAIGIIVLLVVVFVLFYLYHRRKTALQRERVVNTLWNLKPEDVPFIPDTPEEQADAEHPTDTPDQEKSQPDASPFFITRFKEVIEARFADSNASVEDLAADMNLSRVQLYRKVKALTGSSPVELLRTARLNRAHQLLLTTDKTVSEVAYSVGFSSPAYFTKCFKDEFGMVPGDVRR